MSIYTQKLPKVEAVLASFTTKFSVSSGVRIKVSPSELRAGLGKQFTCDAIMSGNAALFTLIQHHFVTGPTDSNNVSRSWYGPVIHR